MITLPEVVVLDGGIHPERGCPRSGAIINLHVAMEGKAVPDLESERGGAGFGAGANHWIDLAVGIGVGAIEFRLEPAGIEQDVGFEAGQRPSDVGFGESPIAGHCNLRQTTLGGLDLHNPVGELLRRQRDPDRHIAPASVFRYQRRQGPADSVQVHRWTGERLGHLLDLVGGKQRVSRQVISADLELRRCLFGRGR